MKKIQGVSAIILSLLLFALFPAKAYATEAEPAPEPAPAPASTIIKMSDGGFFDPAFFAATYPDLVAQIGTDPNAMYQHYLKYGQCQGMKPFAEGAAQSLTYQPGSIVVPASVKKHPEATHTLVYSDANIDIYYSCIYKQGWKDGRPDTSDLGLYFINKTSGDISLFANDVAINGQMMSSLLSCKLFAGATAEDSIHSGYPDSEFDNLSSETVEIKYKATSVSDKYQAARFNLIFYH